MPRVLLFIVAAIFMGSISSCATDQQSNIDQQGKFTWPYKAPSIAESKALIEAGFCKSGASYLGLSACDEWHNFLTAGKPSIPPGTFAVGPTFRVELTKSYQVLWSEKNPVYVLYNAGNSDDLQSIRVIQVTSDNATEESLTEQYILSAFRGKRDTSSPFHAYLTADVVKHNGDTSFTENGNDGYMTEQDKNNVAYVRQKGNRIYLFVSSFHSNGYEYDRHPVLYLSILAAPEK
jgi:hypothetical protein